MRWSKTLILSSQNRLERWKQKTAKLETMLADAKLGLAEMEKEAKEGKTRAEERSHDPQGMFDKELLTYLKRAGYTNAVQALEGDMKDAGRNIEVKPGSPSGSSPKIQSPRDVKTSSTPAGQSASVTGKDDPQGPDSIFGRGAGDEKMEIDKNGEDKGETKDLGELFTVRVRLNAHKIRADMIVIVVDAVSRYENAFGSETPSLPTACLFDIFPLCKCL